MLYVRGRILRAIVFSSASYHACQRKTLTRSRRDLMWLCSARIDYSGKYSCLPNRILVFSMSLLHPEWPKLRWNLTIMSAVVVSRMSLSQRDISEVRIGNTGGNQRFSSIIKWKKVTNYSNSTNLHLLERREYVSACLFLTQYFCFN